MNISFLPFILFITLLFSIVAFFVLIIRKKDENRAQSISAIATILTSITTAIVGMATINIASKEAEREKLQRQPLYTVQLSLDDNDCDSFFENEEYLVMNEGEKTKSETFVSSFSFLEITYSNLANHSAAITKLCPLDRYFGATFLTGNLEGKVQYSCYSKNNNECFFRLYQEALKYGEDKPGVSILIEKKHFFLIEYTDIFGEEHQVAKQDNTEISLKKLAEVRKQAERDAGGKSFNVFNLNLAEIMKTCFPDAALK